MKTQSNHALRRKITELETLVAAKSLELSLTIERPGIYSLALDFAEVEGPDGVLRRGRVTVRRIGEIPASPDVEAT